MSKSTTIRKKPSKRSAPASTQLESVVEPEQWFPRKYHLHALEFALSRPGVMLALDPGLGKTSIGLKLTDLFLQSGTAGCMVVVAPLRVCEQVWTAEIDKWKDFCHLTWSFIHGPKKKAAMDAEADVYLVTPDGLDILLANKKWLRKKRPALIVDESTKFKRSNSQRFKKLKKLLNYFHRRYAFTGTPAPNSLEDLFGQVFIVDQGETLGRYISHYRERWFVESGYGYALRDKQAEKEIHEALKPLAIFMSAADHLDLPPLVVQDIAVELPKSARETYLDMEIDLLTYLESGHKITAVSAAAASMKCRQIANGGLYIEGTDNKEWEELHSAKIEAVEDLVEELSGQPAMIIYEFHHDLARLQRVFGKNLPYIGGGVSSTRLRSIATDWNAGKLPLLACQPAAMGHGLNLQKGGHHIIWPSLIWDLELYEQTIKRVWRQGVKASRVVVHRIYAKNTVDEVILGALRGKAGQQNRLLNAIRVRYRD